MVNVCGGCGHYFAGEVADVFCSAECRAATHRKLRGETVAPRPRKPSTLSLRQAYEALADEAGSYDAFNRRMRTRP